MTDVSFNRKDSCDKMSCLFSDNTIASKLSAKFIRKYSPKVIGRLERRQTWFEQWLYEGSFVGLTVLDVGAGFGINSFAFARAGARKVVANELASYRCQDMREIAKFTNLENIQVDCCSFELSMRQSGPFDVIVSSYFLSHLHEDETFLNLCDQSLKPGGQLLLLDDNNAFSPWRQITVRKEWWRSEFIGNRNSEQGYLFVRRKAIAEWIPSGPFKELLVSIAAWLTRGMSLDECRVYINSIMKKQKRPPRAAFAYRNPVSGIAEERLLNPKKVIRQLEARDFSVRWNSVTKKKSLIKKLSKRLEPQFLLQATRIKKANSAKSHAEDE
jgi:2-polyprenyl-3-methyl-5-hydroxy-6-metoxy-1,4-benzoquinol methylase